MSVSLTECGWALLHKWWSCDGEDILLASTAAAAAGSIRSTLEPEPDIFCDVPLSGRPYHLAHDHFQGLDVHGEVLIFVRNIILNVV